jgi:xanthine dehydrogenase accessory factor
MLITPLVRFLSPYRLSVGSNAPALPTLTQLPSEDESIEALLEPLLPSPTLLIVGAGHVAAPLAQLANLAGFQIVVQDDRSEWMGAERFPSGTQLYPMAIAIALQRFRWPSQLYVVLVTRSYRHDVNALQALLLVSDHSRPCYIGAIGSNQRIRVVVDTLREAGIPLPLLQQIRAPIGLDIGAQTPKEIAVSICAELIQVRRGGTGQPLSQQRQVIPRLLQRKD